MQRIFRKTVSCILSGLLLCLAGCAPGKSGSKTVKPEKLADYLYYLELDSYHFEAMPPQDSPLFTVGCSSIRKGNLYGRNLDLGYCDLPEFIVRIRAAEGRFASIGVCADPTLSVGAMEMTESELLSMPNVTNDGINENGVIISENIVDATGIDLMAETAPGKEPIHASRVVRYLLDRAESAEHAVELMQDLNIVGGFSGYGLHWMIADPSDTYIVEIINGKTVIRRNEYQYMTNFYLNYGPEMEEQTIAGNRFENVPLLNEYAIGVERWCLLRDGYNRIESAEDMAEVLASVRAGAMYDPRIEPRWYSECIGGALSIRSEKDEFEKEMARQSALHDARDRKDPKGDWITWHSSVYDIEKRTLTVYSQEDYSEGFFVSAP